jgi:hypothetical protein
VWWEWLAAQELWRRAAVRGDEMPEELTWWRGAEHEIDFVVAPDTYLEVKTGRAGPLEFAWFPHVFSRGMLTVITTAPFETDRIHGITMEDFLSRETRA